ncbi:MAG: hypothetical protein ACRD2Y_13855 [Terriglobales bacterium]
MLERHFSKCRHCTAVLDGTKNVILLSGDERTFALPEGFSLRLKETLLRRTSGQGSKP